MKKSTLLLVASVAALSGIQHAGAVTGVALGNVPVSGAQVLVPFDTNDLTVPSGAPVLLGAITGGETIVDVDYYPVTGQLFGVSSIGSVFIFDLAAGTATRDVAASVGLSGATNIDFNPSADRLRVFTSTNGTFRYSPTANTNGAGRPAGFVTNDGTLTFAAGAGTPNIGGNAYNNNVDGTPATTLFSIDIATDTLYTNTSAPAPAAAGNFSVLSNPFALTLNGTAVDFGVGNVDNVGFDIAQDGTAYVSNGNSIYTVDLTTGALTPVGTASAALATFNSFAITAVPEPGTNALLGVGLAALAAGWLRRRRVATTA